MGDAAPLMSHMGKLMKETGTQQPLTTHTIQPGQQSQTLPLGGQTWHVALPDSLGDEEPPPPQTPAQDITRHRYILGTVLHSPKLVELISLSLSPLLSPVAGEGDIAVILILQFCKA